ncbi:coagulation factor X-like [Rhincodon typus]|uniref:coagulation factor X-like n=1 Tax=Rhincodon typus TaxID=259920 RepID=UPI0020308897|nr:coagulation factor X-like [Rhincodon typus]
MARLLWATSLFLLLHPTAAETPVFLTHEMANNMLARQKRANSFLEELKEGDVERECIEERCSKEEVREIFENDQRTDEYWNKYVDGDQCESNPCRNGGICRDNINRYDCQCLKGYKGSNCEIDIPQLCNLDNGGCQHYCRVQKNRVKCSCVEGYALHSDEKSCIPQVSFPCGTITKNRARRSVFDSDAVLANSTTPTETTASNHTSNRFNEPTSNHNPADEIVRIVGGQDCPLGECPWQVLLIDESGKGFCGGTILTETLVVTAAHCLNETATITAVVGEFDVKEDEHTEQRLEVEAVIAHQRFQRKNYDNDIAVLLLKKPMQFNQNVVPICLPQREFADTVLMKTSNALVSGWGRVIDHGMPADKLQRLTVPYVDRTKCIESSKYPVSQNMFCAGYKDESKDSCQGDSGGPHVTEHKSTWFLTGIVSWGEGCAQKGKYGIYTKVSRYLRWLRMVIRQVSSNQNSRNLLEHSGSAPTSAPETLHSSPSTPGHASAPHK